MTYKDIAVKNEQKLRQTNQRLNTLLFNAIILLEEQYNQFIILEKLGMTHEEYNKLMGEND